MCYRDHLVEVTDQCLTLKRYYFPLGAKTMALADIERISEWPAGWLTGRLRLWGTASPGVWYALDWRRPTRSTIFRVHLRDQAIDPCFSVERPDELRAVLGELGLMPGVAFTDLP